MDGIERLPVDARFDAPPLPIVVVGHVDHGKSTFIGRLLYDTGSLPEGKVAELQAISRKRGLDVEWSFALDALQIERDQGITLDTTQIWFRTRSRRYVIIDAPGHAEFVRNMLTGASRAEAAVLVIDAAQGLGEQTRLHAYLLQLLGVSEVVVVVNKMDLAGCAQERFEEVRAEIEAYLDLLGLARAAVIPVSARHGDFMAERSARMGWYQGPTVIEALDLLGRRDRASEAAPVRLPVQAVYRHGESRALAGRIESGKVAVGDELVLHPGAQRARVTAIVGWPAEDAPSSAAAGQSVALTFDRDLFAERGHFLSSPEKPPQEARTLCARVFWLSPQPLREGRRLRLRVGAASADAVVAAVTNVIDVDTLDGRSGHEIQRNGVGEVTLRLSQPLVADAWADSPRTGRGLVLLDRAAAGAFVIDRIVPIEAQRRIASSPPSVSREERERAHGHRGGVFWFTGAPGSGKTTVANAVLRQLFDRGRRVSMLDGDRVREGLNADLGFADEDRAENVRRVAHVAHMLAEQGDIVLASLVSPIDRDRRRARTIGGSGFRLIHVDADAETRRARDPKGHYRLALGGALPSFTGVGAPYEAPSDADLTLDTARLTVEEAAALTIDLIDRCCRLAPPAGADD